MERRNTLLKWHVLLVRFKSTLSTNVKGVYISWDGIVFTTQTQVKNPINEDFLEDKNYVMTEHDYAEAIKIEFDMDFQS